MGDEARVSGWWGWGEHSPCNLGMLGLRRMRKVKLCYPGPGDGRSDHRRTPGDRTVLFQPPRGRAEKSGVREASFKAGRWVAVRISALFVHLFSRTAQHLSIWGRDTIDLELCVVRRPGAWAAPATPSYKASGKYAVSDNKNYANYIMVFFAGLQLTVEWIEQKMSWIEKMIMIIWRLPFLLLVFIGFHLIRLTEETVKHIQGVKNTSFIQFSHFFLILEVGFKL